MAEVTVKLGVGLTLKLGVGLTLKLRVRVTLKLESEVKWGEVERNWQLSWYLVACSPDSCAVLASSHRTPWTELGYRLFLSLTATVSTRCT